MANGPQDMKNPSPPGASASLAEQDEPVRRKVALKIIKPGMDTKQVIARYTDLTGRMPLPPLWALGYHQCRYSYYPDRVVRFIAENFRVRQIPADTIWLDIHYQEGYAPFTWDRERAAAYLLVGLRQLPAHGRGSLVAERLSPGGEGRGALRIEVAGPVDWDAVAFQQEIAPGIAAGLVIGKPIGITLFAWAAVRYGIAIRPPAGEGGNGTYVDTLTVRRDETRPDVYHAEFTASRDGNRFLARLALASHAVLRIAPTHAVRAKLSAQRPCVGDSGRQLSPCWRSSVRRLSTMRWA